MARQYTQRKPNLVQFKEIGDSHEGLILRFDETTIRNKTVKRMYTKTDDGQMCVVLMTAQLEALITEDDIGYFVKIELIGSGNTTSGNEFKDFDVLTAEA